MRVAVLFEYDSLNGGERSWLATVPYLQSRGITLCAIAPENGDLADALAEHGVEHFVWPLGIHDEDGSKRSQQVLRSQLKSVLAECLPDLVHANSLSMARTLGPLASGLRLPCVGHLRDILRLSKQVIFDLNGNDRLLAVSEATRQFHLGQGLDADKTHVLYNGVDLEMFRPAEPTGFLHRELGIPTASRLILTIGQIGLRKGLSDAMNALQSLFQVDGNLHWIVVGQRHSSKAEAIRHAESLVERSGELPFMGRVHWLGKRHDVPELMREATLVLHAAKQEPLGRVLLEAAASGLPVVATRAGGTTEILGDGVGSVAKIVPLGELEPLIAAIATVLADEPLCRRMGSVARQRVQALFPAEYAAERLHSHYRQLTE